MPQLLAYARTNTILESFKKNFAQSIQHLLRLYITHHWNSKNQTADNQQQFPEILSLSSHQRIHEQETPQQTSRSKQKRHGEHRTKKKKKNKLNITTGTKWPATTDK